VAAASGTGAAQTAAGSHASSERNAIVAMLRAMG
jgi:hypothetical protein